MGETDDTEIFRLARDTNQAVALANACFDELLPHLMSILPSGTEIRHVGATAVPGCLTKGDLDIAVRVERLAFPAADAILTQQFARNTGSVRTSDFAAFEDAGSHPPLGIQLVVTGSAYDDFHRFADSLRADATLVDAYNVLKRRFNGQPMQDYRDAKGAFVERVLARRK